MSEAEQHQIGRVVCVSGSQVVAVIEPPAPGDGAAPLHKGSLVKMRMPDATIYGIVSGLSIPVPARASAEGEVRLAELELIGEARVPDDDRPARLERGIAAFPALGDAVLAVGQQDLACVYAPPARSTVRIGTVHLHRSQPVLISPEDLLGKPFALLGTSGCGKSCALALILQRILERHAHAHVLLLDPRGEYARAFAGTAELLGIHSLQLPYWLLNSEEIAAVVLGANPQPPDGGAVPAILNELIPIAKAMLQRERCSGAHITVDTPLPYRLDDLDRLLDEVIGRLEKPESLAPYRWLKSRLEVLSADSRLAFMFGGVPPQDTMVETLSRLFRIPVRGKPVTIIDLSGVPSEALNVVVSALCRMIFDFSLWSRGAQPMLLVCEDAHRYAPANSERGFAPAREALARIAREGSKHGVSLCIVSQRPAELASDILAQCGTTFAFRLTGLRDQEILRGVTADTAGGLLDFLPSLGDAEAIVAGAGVALPLRVRFDNLPPERRPLSGTARFSKCWQADSQDETFVAEVVERWRRQQR